MKGGEGSRRWAVQMDDLRGLLIVMRMNRVPNVRIRELCGVVKWVGERIEKVFSKGLAIWKKWKMIGWLKGCMGSHLVGQPRKR